jgi:hypothetical protein
MAEIDELRHAVAALRAEVDGLRAALDDARLGTEPTMRRRLRCPACAGTAIAHVSTVVDRGRNYQWHPMALAMKRRRWGITAPVGEVEAYACTGCGLIEWYVKEPALLVDEEKVLRLLGGAPPDDGGPYR